MGEHQHVRGIAVTLRQVIWRKKISEVRQRIITGSGKWSASDLPYSAADICGLSTLGWFKCSRRWSHSIHPWGAGKAFQIRQYLKVS